MLPPTAFGLNDCEEGGAARFNNRAHVAMFVFMSTALKKCLPENTKKKERNIFTVYIYLSYFQLEIFLKCDDTVESPTACKSYNL